MKQTVRIKLKKTKVLKREDLSKPPILEIFAGIGLGFGYWISKLNNLS